MATKTKQKVEQTPLDQDTILTNIKTEKELAFNDWRELRQKWQTRLMLYNNQKKDPEAVGNNLLYTLQTTLLAFLYFDRLTVSFNPQETGDLDKIDLLNNLARFDYDAMGMDDIEYQWDWDSLFFSTGIVFIGKMDHKAPHVEVVDPFTFYIDPNATSLQDARFVGRELALTKYEMEQRGFQNIDRLTNPSLDDTGTGMSRQAQQTETTWAQNEADSRENKEYDNKQYVVLEWYRRQAGKIMVSYTDFNTSVLLKEPKKIPFKPYTKYPFVFKQFSPVPHKLLGVSVPDLGEDKQRGVAVLTNLMFAIEKSHLYPTYVFDKNAIMNVQALKHPGFNKYIPVDTNRPVRDIIAPVNQVSADASGKVMADIITGFAERAVGATNVRQGAMEATKRTATELQLVQANSDVRQSLAAKLFTNAEKDFWQMWLERYKQYRSQVAGKIIRIQGALGVKFQKVKFSDLQFKTDPDVRIESYQLSTQQRITTQSILSEMADKVITDKTPASARRYFLKRLLQTADFHKDEIDQILPPTFDEMRAQEENTFIAKGKLPEIKVDDDHYVHISIHNQAPDNPQKKAHIRAHYRALMAQRAEKTGAQSNPQSSPMQGNNIPPGLLKALGGASGMPTGPTGPTQPTPPTQPNMPTGPIPNMPTQPNNLIK